MNILGLLTSHHKILIVLEVFYQGEEKSRELFFSRLVVVRQGRFLVIFSLEIGLHFLAGGGQARPIVSAAGRAQGGGGSPAFAAWPPNPAAGPPPRAGPPRRALPPARLPQQIPAGGRGPPGGPRSYLGGWSSGI